MSQSQGNFKIRLGQMSTCAVINVCSIIGLGTPIQLIINTNINRIPLNLTDLELMF